MADPYAHDHTAQTAHAASHEPHYQDERYDDALYGAVQPTPEELYAQQQGHSAGYADDGYGYDTDQYAESEQRKPRRKGLMTVAAVIALAVVGTGGAYAYRNYVGVTRSGEPPVIKADTNPIKVVPPTNASDTASNGKLIQDRLAAGGGGEKLVSREETPVDPRDPSKAGPRVVFPPLNANGNPPSTASVSPVGRMATPQTAPGDEPRKIKTFTVKGDQADTNGVPVAKPAARLAAPATAAKQPAATNANVSGNAPMSLSPQTAAPTDARSRVAALTPAPVSGGYHVQIASQGSEADAQASFKAMQSKYPSVLGSRSPQIKRFDKGGDKGVIYRVTVGPFASNDEAAQMCGSLKSAGGQCFIQRN